ncbi:MAG TPA: hypothetical protein VMI33_03970 [Streptosporangiaceae bacterium]|nr:hypothetical protein [Streptosporangiaceae bacterium]
MTDGVRPPARADRVWDEFAAELTPAKSLARVDTVTARAVTTITVVGLLLTGLGALGAGLLADNGAARGLAVATVITAAVAVACALVAQVLTITRHLNPGNRAEVRAWYRRQFNARAYPTQAATVLLLAAALLAGATAAVTLAATPPATPAVSVTQTSPASPGTGQVTVTVGFSGLGPGQAATVTVTSAGRVLARAVATPAADGTATVSLTATRPAAGQPVIVTARDPGQSCRATLPGGSVTPAVTCRAR